MLSCNDVIVVTGGYFSSFFRFNYQLEWSKPDRMEAQLEELFCQLLTHYWDAQSLLLGKLRLALYVKRPTR